MRRTLLALAVATTTAVAAGCSADGADTGSSSHDAHASDAAAVGWSPCDGLSATSVGRLVGEAVAEADGTTDQPRCTFTPKAKGGAAYDVSYLWFDGGLDAALDAMGAAGAQLEKVSVPGADAARIVVKARKQGVLVTGFVQTDGLVQSVNAAQLAPYSERQVVSGVRGLLGELAERAPAASAG